MDELTNCATIDVVAVVGGGIMGCGIAASLLSAGREVRIVDTHRDASVVATQVIEAISEMMPLKSELWQRLGELAPAHAVLASNTSAFSIDRLADHVPGPHRVLGMHWFNPAQLVPCVEIVCGAATDDATVDLVRTLLHAAGKRPAVVRTRQGS